MLQFAQFPQRLHPLSVIQTYEFVPPRYQLAHIAQREGDDDDYNLKMGEMLKGR